MRFARCLFTRFFAAKASVINCLVWIGRPVTLCVARSNVAAKALYQQYGFKVTEEFEACYNGKPVLANKMEQSSTIFGKSSADTAFSRSRTR
jgi:ribosomal protein S18 acetylase RimI-like enzyme